MRETFQNMPGARWNGEITRWARSLPSLPLAGSLLSGTSPSDSLSQSKCWRTCLQAGRAGLGPEPAPWHACCCKGTVVAVAMVTEQRHLGNCCGYSPGSWGCWAVLGPRSSEEASFFFPRHLWLSGFPSPFTCRVRVGSVTQGFPAYLVTALWCWERLRAGGEGGDRGWSDWMASMTQWTWVWANSRGWWRTGKPGVLQSMGLQRVRHHLAAEQQQFPQGWALFLISSFILAHRVLGGPALKNSTKACTWTSNTAHPALKRASLWEPHTTRLIQTGVTHPHGPLFLKSALPWAKSSHLPSFSLLETLQSSITLSLLYNHLGVNPWEKAEVVAGSSALTCNGWSKRQLASSLTLGRDDHNRGCKVLSTTHISHPRYPAAGVMLVFTSGTQMMPRSE